MATTIKIRGTSDSNEPITLVGRATKPLTRITALIRSRVIREIPLPIESVTEEPDIVFTAQMTAPGQLQQSQGTQLSVDLFSQSPPGGPLTLVEPYVAANWDKAIVSGGTSATLGGVNGDLLTATATLGTVVVEFTYNVGSSPAFGTTASATVEVVATPTFEVVLTGLPASAVQGNVYTLGAQRRDPTTGEVLDNDPANFTFAITVGGTFGSIVNGNQLSVNAGTAGNSITVRATHNVGGEFDDATTNIIVQPAFPDNEPAGLTQLVLVDGSTTTWPGFANSGADWNDPSRVSTVADGASKYGSVTRKKFFVGDESGWHGFNAFNSPARFDEVYTRMVFRLSSNWDYHSGGDKLFLHNTGLVGQDFYVRGGVFHTEFNIKGKPLVGRQIRFIIPGSPPVTSVTGFGGGPFATATRGQLHTIEILRRINSAVGVADGSARVWIDDIEYTRFSAHGGGSEWLDFTMDGIEWLTESGGPAGPGEGIRVRIEAPLYLGGQNDIKAVNDHADISEIYISARNL